MTGLILNNTSHLSKYQRINHSGINDQLEQQYRDIRVQLDEYKNCTPSYTPVNMVPQSTLTSTGYPI